MVERLNGIQEVSGSNPLISTSPNLKRTPFVRIVLGFFFALFRLLPCRVTPLYCRCNAFRVFIENLSITHKRRFMPRKPLDVRKGRGRLSRQRQTKTRQIFNRSGCAFRPYLPIYTPLRGSRQAERGINSRDCMSLHIHFYRKFILHKICSKRYFER